MSETSYSFVKTAQDWDDCLKHLNTFSRVAVDLEANSLYVYQEHICLLQFSTEERDFIVDPLAGFTLEGMDEFLVNPNIEKIFHACEYDLILLKEAYGVEAVNLFDTMWAGRILGYRNMGLAWFLENYFEVNLSKKHQKANWAKRPLTDEQLDYAQNDTRYLIRLRDLLAKELEERDAMTEAREIFQNETRVKTADRSFNTEGFFSMRGARRLHPQVLAVLRELYLMRDKEARIRNVPPFKVMNNDAMISLAKTQPSDVHGLREIRGISERIIQRMGSGLLKAIDRGKKAAPPKPPVRTSHRSNQSVERFECLSDWRKGQAQERDVESDVIIKRETMWEIADLEKLSLTALKGVSTLGPHRFERYGKEILRILREL